MAHAEHSAYYTGAQPVSLDELRHMAHEHLSWLQSDGRDGRRANLSGRDLSGVTLQGMYLPDANLRGANLTGTNLSMANLQGADFSEANLENTNLRDAKLDGANFSRCHAKGTYFDKASLVEANFSHAQLEGANCVKAQMTGAKFRDANVSKSDFTGADLKRANLRQMMAAHAVFDGADLSNADCRDAVFSFSRFKETRLYETGMRGAQFDHVLFTDADFSYALDLDSRYQAKSIESEKMGIQQELENLRQFKDEVTQYENHIANQKRDLLLRRRTLESLNDMELEVSESLLNYMKLFRGIAAFWFVVVALFGAILVHKVSQIGLKNLNYMEISVVCVVMLGVLGAHIVSAMLSFNISRTFARYVRVRREKLFKSSLPFNEPGMPKRQPQGTYQNGYANGHAGMPQINSQAKNGSASNGYYRPEPAVDTLAARANQDPNAFTYL